MTETFLLIGSLSNDLLRVANCRANGSHKAASRFALEAKRWAKPLNDKKTAKYIKNIAQKVVNAKSDKISMQMAEDYLMYSILLQNYALHLLKRSS